mmetsp:Transcript_20880/g.51768  ORF Transcript_20880/g.51768 Transcript_20880/m.51768 type:complete len:294 (-) Transcript_20880:2421-3302(-)
MPIQKKPLLNSLSTLLFLTFANNTIRESRAFLDRSSTSLPSPRFASALTRDNLFASNRRKMSTNSATSQDVSDGSSPSLPRIDSSEIVGSTKWIRLETLTYTDIENKERKWDFATRTTKKSKDAADAVVIIPLLKRPYAKDDDDNGASSFDTLLVEQFRPPVGKSTLEFPAGLIDADETPEQAALRELREETGYVGEACTIPPVVSPLVCMSPGLCDETVKCVVVTVDLDNPYNDPNGALFEATPDEGEHIKVHRVSLRDGFQKLLDHGSSPMAIQGLYLFAMGLEIGKSINK